MYDKKMDVLMQIEHLKSVTPITTRAGKRLREIKRVKLAKALREFASEGVEVDGVGYGRVDTHGFDNAKSALCLFGTKKSGGEFRVELEEYS